VLDIDLSWRVHFLGYQFLYLPRAIVFHRMPQTLWQLLKKKFSYGQNYFKVLNKHRETLKQKKNYKSSIRIKGLLMDDLSTLFGWPQKIVGVYRQLPIQNKPAKLNYLLLPFLNSLDYRSFRLGMLYQAFKIKMRKKWISQ
jgi:cellulose synthase/poly-beta-1,6-N-acetylglucosamine synthase-like glycosyltransferase